MSDFNALWEFIAKRRPAVVQDRKELEYVFDIIQGCESYLEIGTAEGDSLYVLAHALKLGATITSVDLGESHTQPFLNDVLRKLMPSYSVAIYKGNSTDPDTYPQKAPHDVVLIDGGHDYKTVLSDCYMYATLATKFILFHDIMLDEVRKAVMEFLQDKKIFPNGSQGIYHEMSNTRNMGFGIVRIK